MKLTANPDTSDKIRYDMRSLKSSLADLKNFNIFSQLEPMDAFQPLTASATTGVVLGRDR